MTSENARYWIRRRGLPHASGTIARKQPIAAAFLGGSITEGAGASDASRTSYRAMTGQFLTDRFADSAVTCVNAGVGGTNSTFGAHRFQDHVLRHGPIDLLFVEFAVNDGTDREESIRGMEGIVRQCRRLSPDTDIVFLYTAADKNLSAETPFNIAVHEEVAAHYGIPSVNFAAAVYDRIQAGDVQWEELAPDRVHPNDAGYALYAEVLRGFLEEQLVASDEASATVDPAPMDEQCYEQAAMLDLNAAEHGGAFRQSDGSALQPVGNWRYPLDHLFSDAPGESLAFSVTGTLAGVLLLCGADTGSLEYAINGGPYTTIDPFDKYCLQFYRPVIVMFPPRPERSAMRVSIRVGASRNGQSAGHALRIMKFLSS